MHKKPILCIFFLLISNKMRTFAPQSLTIYFVVKNTFFYRGVEISVKSLYKL